MTYPVIVMDRPGSNDWTVQRNYPTGPYTVTYNGEEWLVAILSFTGVRASGDAGKTWETMDAEHNPMTISTSHLGISRDGDTFYLYVPTTSSTCDIFVFDASTMTWGTTLVGPAITWGETTISEKSIWGLYRPSSGTHVIVAQTAIVATFRQCAVYYGSPGSWTGPLYVKTGSSTPTGNHTDVVYCIEGAAERFHIVYSDFGFNMKTRVFDASNTFGTIIDMGFTHGSVSAYPSGIGCTYEDSGTKIALYFGPGAVGSVVTKIARCDSLTSDTAANWTVDTLATSGGQNTTTNPGVVVSDGGPNLFVLRVLSGTKAIEITRGINGVYDAFRPWREGFVQDVYGISGAFISGRVGLMYSDFFRLRYDCIHVYQSLVSKGAGTYTTEHDLGPGGVSDYIIYKDSTAPSGVSSVIEVRMREDEGVVWPVEAQITFGTDEDTASTDEGHTGQTARYIQIKEIVTGGSVVTGATGVIPSED